MEIVLNENEIAKKETIDLSKTFVNTLYGRTIDVRNLKRIKQKFDFNKIGSIIVHKNKPEDETYKKLNLYPPDNIFEILDGNHRKVALQDLFGENIKWEVTVLEGLPYEARAEYFESYNNDRKGLTYTDKFKSRLQYQEPDATAIKRIANDNQVLLSQIDIGKPSRMKFGVCMAISSLEAVYNSGNLDVCLNVLYRAYVNTPASYSDQAYGNLSLRHIDTIVKTYEDEIDTSRLIKAISQMDSYVLNSEPNINEDKTIKAKIVPMKIVEIYNKRLGEDKQLDLKKLLFNILE